MTSAELNFYHKFKELEEYYKIVPQVNLATIIQKVSRSYYHSKLFRNIDFAIFDKDYSTLLLLIELNDNSHKLQKRKNRDIKVKNICNQAGIKLITFYTNLPNEKEYVIQRILKQINNTN